MVTQRRIETTESRTFEVTDHRDARGLESLYFRDPVGRPVGRINGAHCVVTAARS